MLPVLKTRMPLRGPVLGAWGGGGFFSEVLPCSENLGKWDRERKIRMFSRRCLCPRAWETFLRHHGQPHRAMSLWARAVSLQSPTRPLKSGCPFLVAVGPGHRVSAGLLQVAYGTGPGLGSAEQEFVKSSLGTQEGCWHSVSEKCCRCLIGRLVGLQGERCSLGHPTVATLDFLAKASFHPRTPTPGGAVWRCAY